MCGVERRIVVAATGIEVHVTTDFPIVRQVEKTTGFGIVVYSVGRLEVTHIGATA